MIETWKSISLGISSQDFNIDKTKAFFLKVFLKGFIILK